MDPQSNERRLSTRHDVTLDAHYDSSSMDMSGPVTNLSRTGLFLRAQFLDDPGSIVAISLQLPSEAKPIAIAGRVVRVDMREGASGMGIRFTDLSWRSRQRLARFIESTRQACGHSVHLS